MEESVGGARGKERRVTFRMEGGDYDALCERCERAGLSKSEYLRYLVRIPLSTEANAGDEHRILVDRKALWAMSRELHEVGLPLQPGRARDEPHQLPRPPRARRPRLRRG